MLFSEPREGFEATCVSAVGFSLKLIRDRKIKLVDKILVSMINCRHTEMDPVQRGVTFNRCKKK
jgi:hypothetical protein